VTPDELRDRILRWEDPHTDFKEVVDSNSELAKELVCFANSDGGQLVIGVVKDRTVVGVPDTDQLLLRVDDGTSDLTPLGRAAGRRPQTELESSRVVVGTLVGDEIGDDFVDRKDLSGPLLPVIAQIETFLRLHEAMRAGVHATHTSHIYSRVVSAELATRAGTGIRRISRLLRQANGTSLGITIGDAEVVLTLPRGPAT